MDKTKSKSSGLSSFNYMKGDAIYINVNEISTIYNVYKKSIDKNYNTYMNFINQNPNLKSDFLLLCGIVDRHIKSMPNGSQDAGSAVTAGIVAGSYVLTGMIAFLIWY